MVTVHINKPVYESFVYVRDSYLKQAIREGTDIKISCPNASCTVSPYTWIEEGKRLEKVFLHPDRPMILFGNTISKYSGGAD